MKTKFHMGFRFTTLAKLISGQNKGLSTPKSLFTKFQNGCTRVFTCTSSTTVCIALIQSLTT